MGEIMIASVRQYAGRLIATGIAIVLAVAFVVAGLTITDSYRKTLNEGITADMVRADVKIVLKDDPGEDSELADSKMASAVSAVTSLPEVEAVGRLRYTSLDYRQNGAREYFQVWAAVPASLQWHDLLEGRWPSNETEAVVSAKRAKDLDLTLGNDLPLTLAAGDDTSTNTFSIVGIMTPVGPSTGVFGADAVVTGDALEKAAGYIAESAILVKAANGITPESLKTALQQALPGDRYVVQTREEIAAETIAETTGSAVVVQAFILAFGGIALLIAGFVIANTFRLLVAQRTRQLALLRCVGTTSTQVWQLVVGEAALVGLVFSVIGAVLGLGFASGLQIILGSLEDLFAGATITVNPILLMVSIGLGTIATTIFALGPARNAVKVHPLAAMRPATVPETQRTARITLGVGTVITAIGTGVMVHYANTDLFAAAVAGGVVSGVGVIILCKEMLPPLIGLVGRALAPLGATTALAAANATRNKQRTAATGTALLIGTVLIAMLTTGTASVRESVLETIDNRRPVDLVVLPESTDGIRDGQVTLIQGTPNVTATSSVISGEIKVRTNTGSNTDLIVHGIDATTFAQAVHSTFDGIPQRGEAVVAKDNPAGLKTGDTITARGDAGERSYTVRVVQKLAPTDLFVQASDIPALVREPIVLMVVVKLPSGLSFDDIEDVQQALQAHGDDLLVTGSATERAMYTHILNVILMVILGLLAISVIIAVVGIGNTAALSVWERRHELAMMRAVGITRGQLVNMVNTEAVLAAVVSVMVGIGLGILYANAGLTALGSIAHEVSFTLYIPWGQLGLIVIGAFVAALLAAWLPALGAARRPIVEDLATAT